MSPAKIPVELAVYSSAPAFDDTRWRDFPRAVEHVARLSEDVGMTGMLIYTDHAQPDPWALAQFVITKTRSLSPLVALQPGCMHPHSAAKMIASAAYLYGRRIDLNLVAGGFKAELESLGDQTPHDQRYERLVEYTEVVKRLLFSETPVEFQGQHFTIRGVVGVPKVEPELRPRFMMSGSSEAGQRACSAVGATSIVYPLPGAAQSSTAGFGIRVGVIARPTSEAAWRLAHERFPKYRQGEIAHRLALAVSDSSWRHQLDQTRAAPGGVYWLDPFRSYRGNCPYLVGSYSDVADEVVRYIALGCGTLILSEPFDDTDYTDAALVCDLAMDRVRQRCAGHTDSAVPAQLLEAR